MAKIEKSEAEWRAQLSDEEYHVCREKGTERAFADEYTDTKTNGKYLCKCCGEELFASATKFDSGSGWPSFFEPVAGDRVVSETDHSHGMVRTEVSCSNCGCHLGHVFNDGPAPSGERYCINSVSLQLQAEE